MSHRYSLLRNALTVGGRTMPYDAEAPEIAAALTGITSEGIPAGTITSSDLAAARIGPYSFAAALGFALELDELNWSWPYACHREGHVYATGNPRCLACGLPYAEADRVRVATC